MKKRIISILVCLAVLISLNCVAASAFKLAPFIVCNVTPDGVPDGAVYVDLLIPVKDESVNVTNLDKYNMPDNCPIVTGNGEFVSYTFRVNPSTSEIRLNTDNMIDDEDKYYQLSYGETDDKEQLKQIQGITKCRFAYLDKDGNAIEVTDIVKINTWPILQTLKSITIDGTQVHIDYYNNIFHMVLLTAVVAIVVVIVVVRIKNLKKQETETNK